MEKDRVDQFKAEVSAMRIRTGDARRDGALQIVGAVLMLVGFVVDLVVYMSSQNLSDPRDVQSSIILAIAFLALTGAGAVVFLYASLARFLRIWLLRQVYESRSQVDQVVAAFHPAAAPVAVPEEAPPAQDAPAAGTAAAVAPGAGAVGEPAPTVAAAVS